MPIPLKTIGPAKTIVHFRNIMLPILPELVIQTIIDFYLMDMSIDLPFICHTYEIVSSNLPQLIISKLVHFFLQPPCIDFLFSRNPGLAIPVVRLSYETAYINLNM